MTSGSHSQLTIIQVSAEYPPDPGGVGDYTRRLSRALIERGQHVTVLTGDWPGSSSTTEEVGDPPRLTIRGGWSWRSLPRLLRMIGGDKPDIVHIQYQTGAYRMRPMINLLPFLLRRLQRARVIVTMHDLRMPYLLPKAAPLRRCVTRRLLQDAAAIIVTNEADRRRLLGEGLPAPDLFLARAPLRATVIPIGANVLPEPPSEYDRAEWRRQASIPDDACVVAFFGLASPTKGLLELLEALSMLPDFIRLVVVGGEAPTTTDQEHARAVHAAVERLRLSGRAHFTGYCDPRTVSAHLLAADLGALPFRDGASYRRGSLLAMFAHGLPVVTTRPAMPLAPPLIDGQHVLLVASEAPEELAAAIQQLANDPQQRQRLAAGGRMLLRHFSWPAIAAAHEAVYNAVLGQ